MNTELQTFDFNGHALRIFPTDDGQSFYAVAKDATDILGYRTANDGLRSVPDKHKGTRSVRTPGGNQEMLCVDESGLYRLILRSDKPEAEPFMEWVTAEVLPSIRKTGSYGVSEQSQKLLDMQNRLLDSQSAQIAYLQEQLSHSQAVAKGMQNIYDEEAAKVQRLLRARGKVKILERRDIFNKLDEGWEVPEIAKWLYRSTAFVKAVIKAGRYV